MRVNWRHMSFVLFAICVGIIAGVFGHLLIDNNKDATGVIVTVFSILAGFLIAIITLLGDQSVLPGSWRISEVKREAIKNKLVRQKWLFYLYLLTLLVIFISSLIDPHWPEFTDLLERIYFGLAATAFILSFQLPSTLMEVQMDRIDAVVGARRQAGSKLDRS